MWPPPVLLPHRKLRQTLLGLSKAEVGSCRNMTENWHSVKHMANQGGTSCKWTFCSQVHLFNFMDSKDVFVKAGCLLEKRSCVSGGICGFCSRGGREFLWLMAITERSRLALEQHCGFNRLLIKTRFVFDTS